MARIRSVKPEHWDDDNVGSLSFPARLLEIGMKNFADDEGLLRWTPEFLKASIFKYDAEATIERVASWMREIEKARFVFVYASSRVRHPIAFIVDFRAGQRIEKPQPARLPVPNWRDPNVVMVFAHRDGFVCRHCSEPVNEQFSQDPEWRRFNPVCERIKPPSEEMRHPDDPTNIAVVHMMCAKERGPEGLREPADPIPGGFQDSSRNVPGSVRERSGDLVCPDSEVGFEDPWSSLGVAETGSRNPELSVISAGQPIPGTFQERSRLEGIRESNKERKENPPPADGALFPADDLPQPSPAGKPRGGKRTTPAAKRAKKQRTPEEQARFSLATDLAQTWWEDLPIKPSGDEAKVFLGVRIIIEGLLKVGHQPDAVAEAAKRCSRSITRPAMEYQLVAMEREAAARSQIPAQRMTATQQRTQTGQNLLQKMAAREGIDLAGAANVLPFRREITA